MARRDIMDASGPLFDAVNNLDFLDQSTRSGYYLIHGDRIQELQSGYHKLMDEGVKFAFDSTLPNACREPERP